MALRQVHRADRGERERAVGHDPHVQRERQHVRVGERHASGCGSKPQTSAYAATWSGSIATSLRVSARSGSVAALLAHARDQVDARAAPAAPP